MQVFKLCHGFDVTSLVVVVVIVQKQRRDEEEAKRKEIEALQSQLKQLQEMAAQQQKGGVSTTAAAKSDRVAGKKAKPSNRFDSKDPGAHLTKSAWHKLTDAQKKASRC